MLLSTLIYDYVSNSTNQISAQFIELKNIFENLNANIIEHQSPL